MALVLKDRVLESSTSTGTGSFTLTGAQTGYQSFSAIGNGNTTYYTIQGKNPDGTLTGEWEVGIGTWSTGNTLSRDTVLSNSLGTTAKIVFSAGAKDVFCDYPASKSVNQNADNKVLIPYTPGVTSVGSLNVGDATVHTDSGVIAAFTASEPLYLYTSLQNTSSANTSYASYAVNDGGHTSYGELGINNSNYSYTAAGFPNNTFSAPLATFVESYGGPLAIGTWDSQKISFIVNGSVNTADAMTISASGNVSTAKDITVNGLTVGKGDGNVSTNTAFGVDAIGSPYISAGNINNVGIGYNALNTIGSGVGSLTLLTGGSGYDDGFYLVTLEYLSGTPIVSGGTFPTTYLTVEGGVVTSLDTLNTSGFGFIDTTTVFQITSSVIGFGSGFTCKIASLGSATDNTVIGYNAGNTITTGKNNILIGSGTNLPNPETNNTTIIGNSNTSQTFIKGTIYGDSYGSINTTALDVDGALNAYGQLNLAGQAGQNGSFFTTASNSGTLNIGGVNGTGTITLGRSSTGQTINIATGINGSGTTKTINIGTGATSSTAIGNITIGATAGTGTLTFGQSATTGQTVNIGIGSGNIVNVGGTTGTQTLTFGRSTGAQTVNIATGAISSGTKTLNLGSSSAAGSTTTIAIGSTAGTSTTTVNGLLKQQTYTVANLPTGSAGARSFVTDCTALTAIFGTTAVGGGAVGVPVYHDGTSWKVG